VNACEIIHRWAREQLAAEQTQREQQQQQRALAAKRGALLTNSPLIDKGACTSSTLIST